MRIYISGPMTGIEKLNVPAFRAAAEALRQRGYDVCSPVEVGEQHGLEQTPDVPWEVYLRHDIRALCDCDAVAVLDGWYASRGATLEVFIAGQLKLPVRPLSDWLPWPQPHAEALSHPAKPPRACAECQKGRAPGTGPVFCKPDCPNRAR